MSNRKRTPRSSTDCKGDEKMRMSLRQNFIFNKELDSVCLQKIYGGDLRAAKLMFSMFLEVTANEFLQLYDRLTSKEYLTIKQKIHKIKPNFKLVGLTYYFQQLASIESILEEAIENENWIHTFECLGHLFQTKHLPILKNEVVRMTRFI